MKIVSRKVLLTLPRNTLYTVYDPILMEGLYVKQNTTDDGHDFFYDDLIYCVKANSSEEVWDILDKAEKTGTSFEIDLNYTAREGHARNQDELLYIVWEKEDIKKLIKKLETCL
jgi:hypothetical protein